MKLLFPLGLWGLLCVPVIIIIYILKNKYNEQTVPSTYLWTLSEKFFKRRNPFSGLTGLINLILQILTVVLVSLAIARPVFVLKNAANSYCFILDCSGSMNMESDGEIRFVTAKEEIEDVIKKSSDGSSYTLVTVQAEANTVYQGLTDKKLALNMLEDIECSDGSVDEGNALAVAQQYFEENPSLLTYFFTDKTYAEHNGVEIVDLSSDGDINYSINDAEGTLTNGTLSVRANVRSYSGNESLTVRLYVDDRSVEAKTVEVTEGTPAPVEFTFKTEKYSSFRMEIENEDCLLADNRIVAYNQSSQSAYDILLVSETPFFFEAALDVLTDSKVDVIKPSEYAEQEGYGLYIFHTYTPEKLPDAAVWLINSSKSVPDSGFGIRGIIQLPKPEVIEKSSSTASAAKKLLEGVEGKNIYISEYVKYSGMYAKFTTLFSYDSNPLVFAGVNALGNRQVVVGFDLHKADAPLSTDFVLLIGNFLRYSCPDILDKTSYAAGEEVLVNVTANVTNVKGISPSGEEIYIDASTDVGVLRLDKVGTYTVRVTTPDKVEEYRLYSGAPAQESVVTSTEESFSLVGERQFEKTDGEYDPLTIIFVLLAVVFAADWVVYCYEKYQLR